MILAESEKVLFGHASQLNTLVHSRRPYVVAEHHWQHHWHPRDGRFHARPSNEGQSAGCTNQVHALGGGPLAAAALEKFTASPLGPWPVQSPNEVPPRLEYQTTKHLPPVHCWSSLATKPTSACIQVRPAASCEDGKNSRGAQFSQLASSVGFSPRAPLRVPGARH